MIKILIVEDELALFKLIQMNLRDRGYDCTCAYSGVEDYILKPFAIVELLARIEVVLRRYNKDKQEYIFDEFVIDLF